MRPRVVIDYDELGNITVYADEGVTVYAVCNHVPDDRVYLCSPSQIPDGYIAGAVGYLGDGSAAETRCKVAVARMKGETGFSVIDGGKKSADSPPE